METMSTVGDPEIVKQRIQGKGRGKEVLFRYDGQVAEEGKWFNMMGEKQETLEGDEGLKGLAMIDGTRWVREKKMKIADPRKDANRRPPRAAREVHQAKYEVRTAKEI